ncbi:TonB-dependent receptor [candidate division KSB1 bacterium]|nr:TonB-dependent receptor [candidate division KSB1 bacterium]
MNSYRLLYQIFIFLMFSETVFCFEITGIVRHANTLREINKVNVYIKNTSIGTTTNSDGYFRLLIPQPHDSMIVVFRHISYHPMEIALTKAINQHKFELWPRVIQMQEITVEKERELSGETADIPQPVSIIKSKNYEARGFVDAGDLLRTEQSIKVDEELSGRKTVAIRGGNPDDVTVLYNGIKMNSIYDNIFDLSLINLEDVQQIEIIRGSNTALYGAEAVSGVINFVPSVNKNYYARFLQKLGTYSSGDWTLQLNYPVSPKFNIGYSYKKEGMRREYDDPTRGNPYLENRKAHHTANLVYKLSKEAEKTLSLFYLRSNLEYDNQRDFESLDDFNQLVSLRYCLENNLSIIGSYHWLDNHQILTERRSFIDRSINNRMFNFDVEKRNNFGMVSLISAYQYENGTLDFNNESIIDDEEMPGLQKLTMNRQKHGGAAIVKLQVPTGSNFYRYTNFNVTCRYDKVANMFEDVFPDVQNRDGRFGLSNSDWSETTLKFSSHLSGLKNNFAVNAYINYGTNMKFPTMVQQMSMPAEADQSPNPAYPPVLYPEKNRNAELGLDISREFSDQPNLNGVVLHANYFKNDYTNKLITYYTPYNPISFFSNIHTAQISGLEFKAGLYTMQHKLYIELGSSIYSIPEKSAFPFKSDLKSIANLVFEHAGYSLNLHWFHESDQVAYVGGFRGDYWEVTLPGYSNFDVHLSKTVRIYGFKIFFNLSGRNLLDDDTVLEGIAIRDRRYYVTMGLQY